jgi:uncharacterized protein YktA (UPF0223 family)
VHGTTNTTTTTAFSSSATTITIVPTTTSIAATCKAKSIKIKFQEVYGYTAYQTVRDIEL